MRRSRTLAGFAALAAPVVLSFSLAVPQQQAESLPHAPRPAPLRADTASIVDLRAEGPGALERLLALYDSASGAERERLALLVDAVAAQRYATISRLFWYTDLDRALAAARATGKPIVSLRLLGRLDEELSCANSRFFRIALYANEEVARFLREECVLHWSSERPAPRLTIDYGDGRVLERTLAGNSVHYVLDPGGRPIDALPGLYGPQAFLAALGPALQTARDHASEQAPAARAGILEQHHRWAQRVAALIGGQVVDGASSAGPHPSISAAAKRAVTKSVVEMPVIRTAEIGEQDLLDAGTSLASTGVHAGTLPPARLDARSRGLMASLAPTDWSAQPRPLSGAALDSLVVAFESAMTADTATNELSLRPRIHQWFLEAPQTVSTLEAINRRVYSELFLTPPGDPWLGMSTPGAFVGLPADGIVRIER